MAGTPAEFADRMDADGFRAWYREREWARNVREGRPYFNGPSPVPPPERHTPSKLLQCHRKVAYGQANAPAERPLPEGVFWVGRRFEADVVVPYLRDVVHDDDAYVRNSMWVDLEVETDGDPVRFRGSTDPCIVDREGVPILPTEVKTKDAVDHLRAPNRHHRAQVHAYMAGLTRRYDRDVDEAVVLYGSRRTLAVRAFRVAFDDGFWDTVVEWAARHTQLRAADDLPPADPEYDWECGVCDYRHRCGQSDEPYADEGPRGFLPGVEYPRERVVEYLRAHEGAELTPTLARAHPDLAEDHPVTNWACSRCGGAFAWDEVRWDPDGGENPVCPSCADEGRLAQLTTAGQPG